MCWKHQKLHECVARVKMSMFSTHEMAYIWYLLYLILFRRFSANQLTMLQAESQWYKRRQMSIWINPWSSGLTDKRNLFSVKMRDKWRHKLNHLCLMTLHNIGYVHCPTHWSGRCWKCKIEKKISKSELFWYQNVPDVAYPHLIFLFTNKKVIGVELPKRAALSDWKSQR